VQRLDRSEAELDDLNDGVTIFAVPRA
jgi:hypothetical protein